MSEPDALKAAWERNAEAFARWVRTPGHDTYDRFHRDAFLRLLPPPGRRTLDLGCGEGRLMRDLDALGYGVEGVDASPTLVRLARESRPDLPVRVGDAAALPFPDGAFDLVVAFMVLHDVDDLDAVVAEARRVLDRAGRLCLAIVHPINSAGRFTGDDPDAPFVVAGSYLHPRHYADDVERDGLRMRFESLHRPLEDHVRALERAGLLVEALREVGVPGEPGEPSRDDRWRRVPLFLHLRAVPAPT